MFSGVLRFALLVAVAQATHFTLRNFVNTNLFLQFDGTEAIEPLILEPNTTSYITTTAEDFSGKLWGRTDCYSVAECEAIGFVPSTTGEISVVGNMTYYSVSLIDGYNVKLAVALWVHLDSEACIAAYCDFPLDACPEELKVFNSDRELVACQSACRAFDNDMYCCRGEYDNPEACNSSTWPVDYAAIFKETCPGSFTYSYDDQGVNMPCNTSSISNFDIVFA